ncbi:hypothetical protein pEaSNUABM40_00026 [Erwinia phage pEa_SNUABM_40]|uniref:Uncharacterized protein n=1 Tax=Erwinia phage pEa_SNUABM_3 TaxID=2869552 RepID=A0AAE7XIM9_9CAUD|nr:hypothetical protein MPK68_gp026 [Erwinia phage pEa_SNUABM_3]QZE56562.1 hypothetical protein pEaSNUABM20_00026 [Erwinia phage pEa_SNUABM_20]QZE58242.1 hypothetical protein pEaSNUABM40_00026 [Erwinia phage pEa_SNUABM_40]UAW52808.1 hypothetical protein pEaSNUABM23_00026 [Erwinia phage pEa_SNUABM_23]UIW10704.1 hypothetical protein pEaSNUABM23_00026 [Erwinia phage pEa_SNUABM_31]QZE56223.1 hypothetical protein pEaSNUABM3_00026 [Erwinia phage pEa_SNUABM_3]
MPNVTEQARQHKVEVRILGAVGSGKSAVYSKIVAALTNSGATVKHADEKAWTMLKNAGEVDQSSETLYTFSPEVTIEEVCVRANTDMSNNKIMQFFAYAHLPPHLQKVSKPFALLAQEMDQYLPDGAEKAAGLRKLLEAKDCAVRALVAK